MLKFMVHTCLLSDATYSGTNLPGTNIPRLSFVRFVDSGYGYGGLTELPVSFGHGYKSITELPEVPGIVAQA